MTATTDLTIELSYTEGRQMVGSLVADELGITLDEFLGRYDAGEYVGMDSTPISRLVTMLPFVRPTNRADSCEDCTGDCGVCVDEGKGRE